MGMSDHERDIYNTNKEAWGKNAYMLIYERKHKRTIREIDLDQKLKSSKSDQEEQTKNVDYSRIQKHVPEWISKMVEKDNVDFVIDRQVFSNQFFFLIKLALKHISSNLVMS